MEGSLTIYLQVYLTQVPQTSQELLTGELLVASGQGSFVLSDVVVTPNSGHSPQGIFILRERQNCYTAECSS